MMTAMEVLMAKKQAAAKKKKSGATKKKQSRREAERVLRTGPIRRRSARAQPLPGMEDGRIVALDDISVSIADCRQQRNDLAEEEHQLLATALGLLRKHDKTVWKHNGVELVRVPGGEKVRVRLVKGDEAEEGDHHDAGEVFAADAEAGTEY